VWENFYGYAIQIPFSRVKITELSMLLERPCNNHKNLKSVLKKVNKAVSL
jgi:hypothetical protein